MELNVLHLFPAETFHLEAHRQLTQRWYGNGVGQLRDLTIAAGDENLLVPESHGN